MIDTRDQLQRARDRALRDKALWASNNKPDRFAMSGRVVRMIDSLENPARLASFEIWLKTAIGSCLFRGLCIVRCDHTVSESHMLALVVMFHQGEDPRSVGDSLAPQSKGAA